MSDSVLLSFPRDSRYYSVARLVVGGIAAPLQMSYDALDDLQLAISSLLDHEDLALGAPEEEVQLRLTVDDSRLSAAIGEFAAGSLDKAFDRQGGEMGLRRLLDTIVDEVAIDSTSDGEWVTLTKHVKALA